MQEVTKLIEEMAREICAYTGTEYCASGRCSKQWECPLNYKSLEILYNAGYRKQEWISVEERLPNTEGFYLVHTTFNGISYIEIDKFEKEEEFEYFCNSCVTHWQPLPQPPKMKGE